MLNSPPAHHRSPAKLLYFILSHPIPIVWQSPSAILKKKAACVHRVGEIKYCTISHIAGRWRKLYTCSNTRYSIMLGNGEGFSPLAAFSSLFVCAARKFSFSRSRTGYLISLLHTRGCREDGNEGFLGEKERKSKKFNYGWTENPENCFCKRNWSAKNSVRTEKSLNGFGWDQRCAQILITCLSLDWAD